MPTTRYYTPDRIASNATQTFYLTFPFGARREIGVDLLNMGTRWVEITARSRAKALELAAARFGMTGGNSTARTDSLKHAGSFIRTGAA